MWIVTVCLQMWGRILHGWLKKQIVSLVCMPIEQTNKKYDWCAANEDYKLNTENCSDYSSTQLLLKLQIEGMMKMEKFHECSKSAVVKTKLRIVMFRSLKIKYYGKWTAKVVAHVRLVFWHRSFIACLRDHSWKISSSLLSTVFFIFFARIVCKLVRGHMKSEKISFFVVIFVVKWLILIYFTWK